MRGLSIYLSLISLLLTGCASGPIAYNVVESKALNIVTAAGIRGELSDSALPVNAPSSIRDSADFGFTHAAAGHSNALAELSELQSVGFDFNAWRLTPKEVASRNSLFAWMPSAIDEKSASLSLVELLQAATTQAANKLGYQTSASIVAEPNFQVLSIEITNDWKGCPPGNCVFLFRVYTPGLVITAPDFVCPSKTASKTGCAFFNPTPKDEYSNYAFSYQDKNLTPLDEVEFLSMVSQNLPNWIYFYLAPNQNFLNKKRLLSMPIVLNGGNINYFLKQSE